MADIAALGLKVDATGVEAASKALGTLATQGDKAEKALDAVVGVAPKASDGVSKVGKSASEARNALAAMSTAASGLTSVSTAAASASQGVGSLGASSKAAQQTIRDMQAAMAASVTSIQALAKAQEDASKSASSAATAFQNAERQVNSYSSTASKAAQENEKVSKSMDVASTAAGALRTALAVAGVGFGAQELITLVDGYTKYTAQLKLATKSTTDQAVAMSAVSRIATDAQQGLGEVGVLYARIANGTAELNLGQSKLADITETVALSLKVSGAAASESSSAMLQLSQAFASGVLRGEEFNSVNEAAPRLMKALADGLGEPVGALRKMAEEGRLTSAVLAEALPKALGSLREEAKSVQTISGSFTVLKNNIMEFVGAQSNASGTTAALSGSINTLANNLDVAAVAVSALGAVYATRLLVPMAASTAAFIAQQVAVTRAAAAIAGASVTTTAAMGAMTLASRALAAAGGFLLGPWGAAIALVGTGVAAFYAFSDSTSKLVQDIGGLNQPLDDLKKKIDALPPEKRISIILDIKEEAQKKAKEAAASFDDLAYSVVGAFSGARAASADSAKQVNELVGKLEDAKKTGADMTPILQTAAKAASVSTSTLKSWLDLAANIRAARDAAATGEAAGQSSVGGGRGAVNPKTAGDLIREREAAATKLLEISSRENGITKQFTEDMATYSEALRTGAISQSEYVKKVTEANKARYEATKAGKEDAKAQRELNKGGGSSGVSEVASIMARVQATNDYIKALQEQGKTADKITEGERLAWKIQQEIDSGKLKSSQLVQKQKELEAAKQLQSAQEALQTEEKRIKLVEQNKLREIALANYQFQIQERLTAAQQKNEAELAAYGQGTRAAQEMAARISLQEKQQQEIRRMANEHAQDMRKAESEGERDHLQKMYADRLAITQSAYASEMAMQDEFLLQKREKEADWQLGFQQGLQNFVDQSQNMYAIAEQTTTSLLDSMQSTISSSFMAMIDGSKSVGDAFSDMAKGMGTAIIQALVDMAAQWLVYQGVQLLVGKTTQASAATTLLANAQATSLQAGLAAFASTAAIPIVGPLLAPAAMGAALAATQPMALAVGATALAGMAHDGIDSIPATGTWLLEKGERVTTANTSAKLDGVLSRIDSQQRSSGSMSNGNSQYAPPIINVVEDASRAGEISTSRDESGQYSTTVFVRNIRSGGDEASVLEQTYGLQRVGT